MTSDCDIPSEAFAANPALASPDGAKRLCFVLNNVGEYHVARLNRCAAVLAPLGAALTVIEASTGARLYTHRQRAGRALLRGPVHVQMHSAGRWLATELELWRMLEAARPTHIFTIGYSDRLSLTCLAYARLHGLPIFFMGDSKADDQPRSRRSERLKTLILKGFHGALVAGERHRAYFRSLGMTRPIELGFDVVDNDMFALRARRWDARADGLVRRGLLPARYVLCVSRLVERKRVAQALSIFAASGLARQGVRFVLIGSGPLEAKVLDQALALGIGDAICHYRDVRNSAMPLFYARATALILASEYDQWGLCVNEAQATGLPCIVTQRCGVAGEIVHDGVNGCVFTPETPDHAVAALQQLFADDHHRAQWSKRCVEMMDGWNLDRYAQSVGRLCGVMADQSSAPGQEGS